MKHLLLLVIVLLAFVPSCGNMDEGALGSAASAQIEPIRDGGTNGYHCGPNLDMAYICHTPEKCNNGQHKGQGQGDKGKHNGCWHKADHHHKHHKHCAPVTVCVPFDVAEQMLANGDTLGACP